MWGFRSASRGIRLVSGALTWAACDSTLGSVGIRVLGRVHVDGDDMLRPRERVVLGALVACRPRPVSPDQIADAVWRESPPPSWAKQVQICVTRLRKVLGNRAVETVDGGYRLVLAGVGLDADEFESLLARARELASIGEPDRAATALTRALGLFRGPPFADLAEWAPAATEAARLVELRRSAQEDLLDARLAVGEHREVAVQAEALVAEEPLRERRWFALALAQYRGGRQADALRTLRRARLLLREELGIDPGPELTLLEGQILRQDEALKSVPAPRSVLADCPYKGLAPLDVGDLLFGRDAEVALCCDRLAVSPLLVVTGPSGSGKSSLVRAGLAAESQRRGRRCVVVVPDPDGAVRLPSVEVGSPIVVIDQFEGVFPTGRPAELVTPTCAAIVAYAQGRAPVVLAVRADRLGDLAVLPSLGGLAEDNLHLVRPLTGDALREAIEKPAVEAGLRLEAGLVDLVVRDTEGEPGALPLMSHALAETWGRRDGNVLTVEGYRATGGIHGAVARSADRLYESLPAEDRKVLRSVLLRLVAPTLDGEPLRCRVPSRVLRGDPAREHVMSLLIQARLVTAEDEVVEISHEALARAWPRLRSWLEDDSAGQRILRHLATAADGWESLGRPDSELYRGARLEAAEEYCHTAVPDLTRVEIDFLDTSLRHAEAERAQLRLRARLDAQRNRRLHGLLAAAVSLLLVATLAGLAAVDRARDARTARDAARLEALVSRSLALRATDRDVAALLAVEAARRWPNSPQATSALVGTFTGAPGFLGNQYVDDATGLSGVFVPGTTQAVVARDSMRLDVRDLQTGEVVREFVAPDVGDVFGLGVAISGDGRRLAHLMAGASNACADGREAGMACTVVVVYDVATGTPVLDPVQFEAAAGGVAVNEDGTLIAVVHGGDGAVTVISDAGAAVAEIDALPKPLDAPQLSTIGSSFGPDGHLYVGSFAGPVRVVAPQTGRVLRTLDAPAYYSNVGLHVGADGVVVAVGQRGMLGLNARTGARLWTQDLRGTNPDPCPFFVASESTDLLYCGTHYGEIEQRSRSTGLRTGVVLETQLGSVGPLSLTADGQELVAFGNQTPAITRWRLDGSGPITRRIADGYVTADGFDVENDATLIVQRRTDSATRTEDMDDYAVWDTLTNRAVDELEPADLGMGWIGPGLVVGMDPREFKFRYHDVTSHAEVDGPDIGPECEHVWLSAGGLRSFCGSTDGKVWTIDTTTRELTTPTLQLDGRIWSVSATRGGERVVVTAWTDDGPTTTVHDGETGALLAGPLHGPNLTSVSLDGQLVGTRGGRISRYDLDTLDLLGDLPGAHGEVNMLQWSDDGRTLLATSNDQSVSLYDAQTGTRLGDPIPTDAPYIYPAHLSHDGQTVALTDARGIALWHLRPAQLQQAACRLAGRNLSPSEWVTYIGDADSYRQTCPGLPVPAPA
jgi:DNA-binding SARP family transcriptional activator/WD40 repeat protein